MLVKGYVFIERDVGEERYLVGLDDGYSETLLEVFFVR